MNKLFKASVAAIALGFGLIGCLTGPEETKTPKISINSIDSITIGNYKNVTGEISSEEVITKVEYAITTSAGAAVSKSVIDREGPEVSGVKKFEFKGQNSIKISPLATATPDLYKLKLTVTAGVTVDVSFDFKVVGGSTGDILTTMQVTVGNQNAGPGSALDVDAMVVYTSTECKTDLAKQAAVDLWFGIASGAKMMAPSVATSFAPANHSWTNRNPTKMLKVSANFDQITTQSQIDVLWNEASSVLSTVIAAGDVFVIKTATGQYRLLKIVSASTSESGEAVVVGKIK